MSATTSATGDRTWDTLSPGTVLQFAGETVLRQKINNRFMVGVVIDGAGNYIADGAAVAYTAAWNLATATIIDEPVLEEEERVPALEKTHMQSVLPLALLAFLLCMILGLIVWLL